MDSYERVHEYLSKLGLTTMESTIDSYLETSHDRPVMDVLDHLLSEELKHKLSRKTENMINWSVTCSLYPLDSYKRDIILLRRYIGESRGGFTNLLHILNRIGDTHA
jgi:hypothetical protein